MSITFTLPNNGLYQKMYNVAQELGATNHGFIGLFTSPTIVSDLTNQGSLTGANFGGYGKSRLYQTR